MEMFENFVTVVDEINEDWAVPVPTQTEWLRRWTLDAGP